MYRDFRPSSAGRWVHCAAAPKLSDPHIVEEDQSEAALEGTAAHEVAERMYKGESFRPGDATRTGPEVTEEMIDGAVAFCEVVPKGAAIETYMPLDVVADGLGGTPDASFVDEDENRVKLYDYKFGYRPVYAHDNWQLLVYAAGFLEYEPEAFEFHIIQPRAFRESLSGKWTVSYEEYVADYLPMIQAAARNVLSDNPKARAGRYCKHCPARAYCGVLREEALGVAEMSFRAYKKDLPADALGFELKTLHEARKQLEARIEGLEEQAIAKIGSGTPVDGFTKEPRYGRKTWSVDKSALFQAGDMMGVDLRKPPEPVTPNQAVKAGLDKNTVETYSKTPVIGDKLKPVNLKKLKGVFDND